MCLRSGILPALVTYAVSMVAATPILPVWKPEA
jgi:hypothetical protein